MQSLHLSHSRCSPAVAAAPRGRCRPAPRRLTARTSLPVVAAACPSKDDWWREAYARANPTPPPPPPHSPEACMAAGTLLSHLPDASIELAATADLSLSVDGHQLPLHSAVLAAGAQVLRAALCGAGIRGNASAKEVAAQLAFEGHSLEDTCSFLRVLYDTYTAEGMPASQLEGVLALAAKLGAPGVLQACDARLCALMKEAAPNSANGSTTDKDAPPLAIDWAHWLPLADRYRLRHLLPLLVEKQLRKMADASTYAEWKAAFVELDSSASALSADTWKLLCEGMAKTAVSYQNKANEDRGGYYRSSMGQLKDCIPKTFSRWSKPGDLF